MTIKYKSAVAEVRTQIVQFDLADAPTGVFVPLMKLPMGAVVLACHVDIPVIFNAGTTDVLSFGTVGTPALLLSSADAKTTTRKAATISTLAQANHPTGAALGVTRTAVGGAATTGQAYIVVQYSILSAQDEVYG